MILKIFLNGPAHFDFFAYDDRKMAQAKSEAN